MRDSGLNPIQERVCNELRTIVGVEGVLTDQAEVDCASVDFWWITQHALLQGSCLPKPLAVVYPTSREEVVRIVALCNRHRLPLVPRGGGAGNCGGSTAISGAIVLDTKRMDKILELNEKSLTVRVQPGIIQKHLEEYLNARGYTMNHLPASFTTSTLGGFIGTNGSGILSSKYGKVSDMVHQIEVVLPSGKVFRSLPVRQHSTGPDYSRLFIGAEGTLGVVTEAVCKIYALPERRAFSTFLMPDLHMGIEGGRRVMQDGLQPCLMRLYDEKDTRHTLAREYGIEQEGCVLLLGFDGLERIVEVQSEIAAELLCKGGGRDLGEKPARNWWENRYKSYYPPNYLVGEPWMWDVMDTVAPYEKVETIYWGMRAVVEEGFSEVGAEFHAHFSHWYDWGTSFYPTFIVKHVPKDYAQSVQLYQRIVESCVQISIRNGGAMNEHHGVGVKLGRFMQEIYGEGFELAEAVKNGLDPMHIMNPGKLGLGEW